MTEPHGISRGDAADGRPAPEALRSRNWGVLAAGAAGFVCGIVFWHLVGFWSLVNEVMFHHAPGESPAPLQTRSMAAKSQGRQPGALGPMPMANGACSEVLPGADGFVHVASCGAGVPRFAPARGIDRADFADFGSAPATKLINGADAAPTPGAPAVSGWAAAVEPVAKP